LTSELGGIKAKGAGTIKLKVCDVSTPQEGLTGEVQKLEKDVQNIKEEIHSNPEINMPSKIYAVVGETIQIFYNSIIETNDINNYYVKISGEGKSFPRYFELMPTSTGNLNMTVQIFNSSKELTNSKDFVVEVNNYPSSPLSKTNIMLFGDSLIANGNYPKELKRLLTSNDEASGIMPAGKNLSNIDLVGLMQKDGAHYYGIGGWGWNNYAENTTNALRFEINDTSLVAVGSTYTINGCSVQATAINTTDMSFVGLLVSGSIGSLPQSGTFENTNITYTSFTEDTANPLWDGEKVSFSHYFNECGATGGVGVIAFLLGWNLIYMPFDNYTSMITTLITTAHSEYPSCKFVLLGLQCPSNNGGLADNYGNDTFFSNKQNVISKVHEYNNYLKNIANQYNYVDYVDIASQFDSDNNMPEELKNVNTRNNTIQEYIGTNGVHPSIYGYYQIADVLYRYIVAKLCQ
jgi:hypothetical protein